MPMLHDTATRTAIEARARSLRPDAKRKWGTMRPDQMLWHLNQFMSYALGESTAELAKTPLPRPIFRFVLLHMPWPKSAPTLPSAKANETHDLSVERERFIGLLNRFASRPIDGPWPVDPLLGKVTGRYTSKLQAKHIDHHFRQFSC